MKHNTCLVPDQSTPVPADLRGKRQALFFLLAQSQPIPAETSEPQVIARVPSEPTRAVPDMAPAPQSRFAILSSDDFQFTF